MVNEHAAELRNIAKKSYPARHAQRGAAVFVVMLVLTILTAVGIFAVRSSSLADVAAGYDREGAQASLIAEYGITAVTTTMATATGDLIVQRLNESATTTDATKIPYCQSNGIAEWATPPPPPRAPCLKMYMSAIESQFTGTTFLAPSNITGSVTGSTSSLNINETTNATFVVEFTEGASIGGLREGGGSPSMITLTSISQVRPAAVCAAGLPVTTAGQQAMRAMISAGTGVEKK